MSYKKFTFGQVRELPKDSGESRIVPFVLSTFQKDRYGTVLNQDNWQLESFRANPVLGYMHNLYGDLCQRPEPEDVIGKGMNPRVEPYNGRNALLDEGYFEERDLNLRADTIFRKLILGTLSAASVGFLDKGGKYGMGDEAAGKPNETFYFTGQELLEWSVVNIPGNAGAGKRGSQVMRENTYAALMYAFRELDKKYTHRQIEEMRVCDVIALLNGKDLEIREKDPEKVRQMLEEENAIVERNAIIEKQQRDLRLRSGTF